MHAPWSGQCVGIRQPNVAALMIGEIQVVKAQSVLDPVGNTDQGRTLDVHTDARMRVRRDDWPIDQPRDRTGINQRRATSLAASVPGQEATSHLVPAYAPLERRAWFKAQGTDDTVVAVVALQDDAGESRRGGPSRSRNASTTASRRGVPDRRSGRRPAGQSCSASRTCAVSRPTVPVISAKIVGRRTGTSNSDDAGIIIPRCNADPGFRPA